MKPCPDCATENHDQAVECKKCLRPFGGYVQGRQLAPTAVDLAQTVRIVDLNMPFMSMVTLMIKWAFATIPAMIVLIAAAMLIVAFFGGLGLLAGV